MQRGYSQHEEKRLRVGDDDAVRAVVQTLALDGVRGGSRMEPTGAEATKGCLNEVRHVYGGREQEWGDRNPSAMDASNLLLEVGMLLQQSSLPRKPSRSPACRTSEAVADGQPPADRSGGGVVKEEQPLPGGLIRTERWRFHDDRHRGLMQPQRHEVDGRDRPTNKIGFCSGNSTQCKVRSSFAEPSAPTSVVPNGVLQRDSHSHPKATTHLQPSATTREAPTANSDNDDVKSIRDNLLRLKEARRLWRRKNTQDDAISQQNFTPTSFCQHLDVLRTIHFDAEDAMNQTMQLLLTERKLLSMRCTVLYDRVQKLQQHRATLVSRMQDVYGQETTQNISKLYGEANATPTQIIKTTKPVASFTQ